MLMMPDPTTARLDPYTAVPTMYVVCDLYDPITRKRYDRDPRGIAQRAEAHLKNSGIGDIAYMGPEPEFFVFDNVRFDITNNASFHSVDSIEGYWNSGSENGHGNLGYTTRPKAGYFPVAPHDTLQDIRTEMVLTLEELGIPVEVHHHEVGTAGQCEIDMRFDTLLSIADKVMTYKYVVRNTARKHGKVATFMPKPIFADNGSGMHVHQSIWKDGKNLMSDPNGYAGIERDRACTTSAACSSTAPALLALAAPTVNTYRRLGAGFRGARQSGLLGAEPLGRGPHPDLLQNPKSKRIEFRCPDTAANPYLLFRALLMAGLDGIKNKIDPGAPAEYDLFEADKATAGQGQEHVPGSLREVLGALEADHEFLLEGEVFTQDFIENWIDYKRDERDRRRPTCGSAHTSSTCTSTSNVREHARPALGRKGFGQTIVGVACPPGRIHGRLVGDGIHPGRG